tara:strand:+ start:228 stop:767 length:540 start_codon:yes stop_codon:yes gene_type:complete
MKKLNLYSILFILSFFLFSCEDDGSENVKEKDKFSTLNDQTLWYYKDTDPSDSYEEWFYVTKDNLYMYDKYNEGGVGEEWCMKIPIKDGQYKDPDGYDYLLNVLKNEGDTLTLQFAEVPTTNVDDFYFGAGEIDFVTRGNILTVTMHYLESNGTFDSELWGNYTKTDNDQKPTTTCTGG